MKKHHNKVLAGDIIKKEFLKEMDTTSKELADLIKFPHRTIKDVLLNRKPITAELDKALCNFYKMSDGFFLRLQDSCIKRNKSIDTRK